MLEFNGRLVNKDALLNWKTENEEYTSEFIIERSLDGRQFKAIGNVASFNTPGTHTYQFSDHDIVSSGAAVLYYRLQQKDKDGKINYSRIVALPVNSKESILLLYPNPVTNAANLVCIVDSPEKLTYMIIDNMGRIVKQKTIQVAAGNNSFTIDLSGMTPGMYHISIKGRTLNKQIGFIKE